MKTPQQKFATRIMEIIMSLVFGGIGLTVFISLWASPFGDFHSPPIFFRIVGSLISIPFIAIGFAGLTGMLSANNVSPQTRGQRMLKQLRENEAEYGEKSIPSRTICPRCSAPIGEAEISPSGDVKCQHCQHWYNVRN